MNDPRHHLEIFPKRRVARIARITPARFTHGTQSMSAVMCATTVTCSAACGHSLPHHPECGQQMHRIAEKAEVEHHDFFGGACARENFPPAIRPSEKFKPLCAGNKFEY